MNLANILYETPSGKFWVMKTLKAYEVYRNTITHAERCAVIGLSLGLERAIAEADKQDQAAK